MQGRLALSWVKLSSIHLRCAVGQQGTTKRRQPEQPTPGADSQTAAPPQWIRRAFGAASPLFSVVGVLLLMYFAFAGWIAAILLTPTVDEFCYVPMGLRYWRTGQ